MSTNSVKNAIERLIPLQYFIDAGIPRQSLADASIAFSEMPRPKAMFRASTESKMIEAAKSRAQAIFHGVLFVVAEKNETNDATSATHETHASIDNGRFIVKPRTDLETLDDVLRHGQYYVVIEEKLTSRSQKTRVHVVRRVQVSLDLESIVFSGTNSKKVNDPDVEQISPLSISSGN